MTTTRTLTSVMGNSQRLDGGAMFGNAPRAVWQKWIAPDELNRIPLACRTMLIEEKNASGTVRNILFETGIGVFFAPKLRERFGVVEERHMLVENLAALGVAHTDIDVVVLSHLHFDHAGGLLTAWSENESASLLFPRAHFVVGAEAFKRAESPHARDRASFIPELQGLLRQCGRLEIVEGDCSNVLGPEYRLHRSDGHTPGLMLAEVSSANGPVVFAADLIPGRPWVHLPITMGYDRYPERLIEEKTALLTDLVMRAGRLFFTHDPTCALSRVARNDDGRFHAGESWEQPVRLAL